MAKAGKNTNGWSSKYTPKRKQKYLQRSSSADTKRVRFFPNVEVYDDVVEDTISMEVDGISIMATRKANRKYGLSSSAEIQAVELFGEISRKWG